MRPFIHYVYKRTSEQKYSYEQETGKTLPNLIDFISRIFLGLALSQHHNSKDKYNVTFLRFKTGER
jgi:hypothetical protein